MEAEQRLLKGTEGEPPGSILSIRNNGTGNKSLLLVPGKHLVCSKMVISRLGNKYQLCLPQYPFFQQQKTWLSFSAFSHVDHMGLTSSY
jgi:hypothetical protein